MRLPGRRPYMIGDGDTGIQVDKRISSNGMWQQLSCVVENHEVRLPEEHEKDYEEFECCWRGRPSRMGPNDPSCAWLEIFQEMVDDRLRMEYCLSLKKASVVEASAFHSDFLKAYEPRGRFEVTSIQLVVEESEARSGEDFLFRFIAIQITVVRPRRIVLINSANDLANFVGSTFDTQSSCWISDGLICGLIHFDYVDWITGTHAQWDKADSANLEQEKSMNGMVDHLSYFLPQAELFPVDDASLLKADSGRLESSSTYQNMPFEYLASPSISTNASFKRLPTTIALASSSSRHRLLEKAFDAKTAQRPDQERLNDCETV
ncbi:hypothetical protein T265_10167 [Opisthorchis viverrini]|uniref:Uncharacterized protein n=1 Tax=Opisthorchis viverrini TaxID=6198 RepID=A0A074ZEA7_OPIVI|nr:hypothetical protein T265_10167 [Opisthorchis viverrini]KER21545.1 hypothetical protein T265_10167 [Opisthorchis viverrini]